MTPVTTKMSQLQKRLLDIGPMLIAYSGGTDSSFLLAVAHSLKKIPLCAVTVKTELIEQREIDDSINNLPNGINHFIIEESIMKYPEIIANPAERCYLCKKIIFQKILLYAREHGYSSVVEGSHADDLQDYRPGARALQELNIISPLKEAGLTKEEIRTYARELNVPAWNKPANPCLATRVPYGTLITIEKLQRIEKAEKLFIDMGFSHVRVRDHGEIARIEVPRHLIPELWTKNREFIIATMKSYGYTYITLDLAGYRMGSMNEILEV